MLIRLLDMMPRTVISKRPCRAAEASSPSQMRLAELSLSRLSWGCKIMAAMVGYFDDSCTEGLVLTVAGLIGDERQWEQFDRTWPELLKRHDVPYFHMKEMVKPNGVFAKWLPPQDHAEERRAFFSDIVETISTCRFGAFGAIVRIGDLARFNADKGLSLDPYSLAVYACFLQIDRAYPSESVSLTFDRIEKVHSRLDKGSSLFQMGELASTSPAMR